MKKILFVAPTQGNGGIASWAANFRKNCPKDYELISICVSKRRSMNTTAGIVSRIFNGVLDMYNTIWDVKKYLRQNHCVDIMHLTISGKPGTIRDYFIVKTAVKKGVKCIVHCHFGSVWSQINEKSIWGKLLNSVFEMANQIWVLDSKSLRSVKQNPALEDKVLVNPNFIDVPLDNDIPSKKYKNVAFVGNLIPSKGIYELVEAVASMNNGTMLHIIGPGQPEVVEKIELIAGAKLGKEITLYGRVTNAEAIEIIDKMDIIALPTYYPCEAFPISILEAMSRGKMVISCDRGAISDMLTAVDGSSCGLLVKPKDSNDLVRKIQWCQENVELADNICRKAYKKVYETYRTDVVMQTYANCYDKLMKDDKD